MPSTDEPATSPDLCDPAEPIILDEPEAAPLGLDRGLCGDPCPSCGGPSYDLGEQQADAWVGGKHWYKCASCGRSWSKATGPACTPSYKSDYHLLKEKGLI